MSPSSTSQEMTSLLTQARVKRRETRRRRGASRRSSTTTAMPRLLHHTTKTTTLQKGKQLIKNIHLIIPVFHLIQMLICYQFHLGNLHTLMEKTTLSGVIKCVVIYFLSILVCERLLKTECILIVQTIPFS
jgi:DNA integrity scanning protein DisA with diadenylate cyclase activity